MRSLRLTLCTGAVVAAALTPTAYAADVVGDVSVAPATTKPGGDIQVRVEGCEDRTGTATSEAFVADAQLTGKGGGTLRGESRVRSSTEPGTYDVRITCDGRENKLNGVFRVGYGKSSPPAKASAKASTKPTSPASPVAPVRAGGGGAAARLAAVERAAHPADDRHTDTGPGARHAVIGLVLAGAAAAVVVVRGVRRGRGTE